MANLFSKFRKAAENQTTKDEATENRIFQGSDPQRQDGLDYDGTHNGLSTPSWDVIGIASVATTLAGAAIFYAAGWVYESFWFSYYGLDLSLVDPSLYHVMMMGVPGIMGFVVLWAVTYLFFVCEQRLRRVQRYTYFPPLKARHAFQYALVVFGIVTIFLVVYFQGPRLYRPLTGFIRDRSFWYAAILTLFLVFVYSTIRRPQMKFSTRVLRSAERFHNVDQSQNVTAEEWRNDWYFWVGAAAVLLLTSILFSSFWGRYEAVRGKRLIMGNWQLSPVYILTNSEIPLLWQIEKEEVAATLTSGAPIESPATHKRGSSPALYGPFGLLVSNHDVYVFTDLHLSTELTSRPSLYVIPRDNQSDIYLVLPGTNVSTR